MQIPIRNQIYITIKQASGDSPVVISIYKHLLQIWKYDQAVLELKSLLCTGFVLCKNRLLWLTFVKLFSDIKLILLL